MRSITRPGERQFIRRQDAIGESSGENGSKRNIYERKTKQSFICLHRVLSNGVTELGVVNVEILIVIFKLRMFPYYYPGCSRGFIRKDVPSYPVTENWM